MAALEAGVTLREWVIGRLEGERAAGSGYTGRDVISAPGMAFIEGPPGLAESLSSEMCPTKNRPRTIPSSASSRDAGSAGN